MKYPYLVTHDILYMQLYSAAGHGWAYKDGWLTDDTVCDWENVNDCNAGSMVTELDLHSNNLAGRIPPEISHIRMLGTSFFLFCHLGGADSSCCH